MRQRIDCGKHVEKYCAGLSMYMLGLVACDVMQELGRPVRALYLRICQPTKEGRPPAARPILWWINYQMDIS